MPSMTMIPKTRFTDGVINLRPFKRSDAPALVEAAHESIPEIQPWMPWCHAGYDEAQAKDWLQVLPERWESGAQYTFAIVDSQSQTVRDEALLGECHLNHINPLYRLANLTYWVRTSRTRQAVASRAIGLIERFALEQLDLIRVEIVVAEGNQASQKAAQKAGAQREGILRNRILIGGRIHDAVMHSLVPKDFGLADGNLGSSL